MNVARALSIVALALLLGSLAGRGLADPSPQMPSNTVPGQVLVRFRAGELGRAFALFSPSARLLLTARAAVYKPLLDVWRLELLPDVPVAEALDQLRADPAVALAQPNYRYTSARAPDDPRYREAQHPYYGAINAPAGWDVETGSADVIVAVLDGGVDITHPELEGRIWTNAGEQPNGLDDDGNGCRDDLHGCNFLVDPPTGDVADLEGHGTFVAGIIGAKSDNGVGVAGMAWNVTVMPVRVLDPSGTGNTEDLAAGILYAARNGARIENLSLALVPELGKCPSDPIVDDALRQAHDDHGATILAAAGNFNLDCVAFPASSPYTIAVAAAGPPSSPDTRAFFSQWGPEVDVAAPGIDIVSILPGDKYGTNLGTSFSTPIVAGLAALLLSQDSTRTNEQLRHIIRQTARDLPDDQHANWDGAGLIDVGAALGAGSAFAFLDASALAVNQLSFSLAVGDAQAPLCQISLWDQPSVSANALQGSFGAGECAAFWPPTADRPWLLRARQTGTKAATLDAWSLRSGDGSCAAADLPAPLPPENDVVSAIDCQAQGVVSNDEPPQATTVDPARLPQRFQQDVRQATAQGDPDVSCAATFSRSVWYRLPPSGGPEAIVADTFGSDFDTVLVLYRGQPGSLQELACNDDFKPPQSRLVWLADGVSTYYLMAAALQTVPAGRLHLNLSPGFIPANDSRDRPTPISPQDPYPLVLPAHSATRGADDPALSCAASYGFSLWFRTQAGADGRLTLDPAGTDYDAVIGVLRRDQAGNLQEVGCSSRTSPAQWQAQAGRDYLVVVGAFAGRAGGVLHLTLSSD